MSLLRFFFLCCLSFYSALSTANVVTYFESIKNDPNALYAFFKKMPKGGELHYHLAGGAYPEAMLKLSFSKDYCLNKENLALSSTLPCEGLSTRQLELNPRLYEKAIRAWSLKDFISSTETAYDHFFNSFAKFMPIVNDYSPALLVDSLQRADNQHELYLEVMVLLDKAKSSQFGQEEPNPANFNQLKDRLLDNQDFRANIQYTIDEAANLMQETRQLLGCAKEPNLSICKIKVGFQYYVLREQPLPQLFSQALNAFAAANESPYIVGVNLVQPEDGLISLRDYKKQMQIFNFLHQLYPQVHISLHAGELGAGRALPDDLRFHIHDAIWIGKAERIGHGVDLAFEDESGAILKRMADNKLAVEVNLISNKRILNVTGKKHPLNLYLKAKVPVVLSTDDEGILRTDLTSQYVEAALKHQVPYPQLKQINRNAITYSFLSGKSLWLDAENEIFVDECKNLDATSCLLFIKSNEKAGLQWRLEKELKDFEDKF